MKKWIIPSALALTVSFMACNNQSRNESAVASKDYALTTPTQTMMNAVASNLNDSTPSVSNAFKTNAQGKLVNRKIIRKATVKSKVANTEQATYKIEQITQQFGGFITQSQLESRVMNEHETPVSTDSVMKVASIQISNNMVVRVPNHNLDTFLVALSHFYAFLDSRKVSSEDVTHNFISHQLKAKIRDRAVENIGSSVNKARKLDELTEAERTAIDMKDEAIDHEIANLETNYNIQYSEVNLEIYQQDVILRSMAVNPSVLEATPNFGYRLWVAFKNGGTVLINMFIGVVNLWALIVLGLGAWFIYRKYHHNISLYFNSKPTRQI